MKCIVGSFDDFTDLFFEGMKDQNGFELFAVNINYNSNPPKAGQLNFVLHPQNKGFVEENATSKEYVALKEKTDSFKKLLTGLGVFAKYLDENDRKTCATFRVFPDSRGGPPAWALYGEVPDTKSVMNAIESEILRMKGPQLDEAAARMGAIIRLCEQKTKESLPGNRPE